MASGASVRRDRLVTWTTAMAGRPFSTRGGSTARSRARRGERSDVSRRPGHEHHQAGPTTDQRAPTWRATATTSSTIPTAAAPEPSRVTVALSAATGPGHGNGLQGPGDHVGRGAALDLGVGAQDHPVGERGLGHGLDVSGVTKGRPSVAAATRAARSRARPPRGDTPRRTSGIPRVRAQMATM